MSWQDDEMTYSQRVWTAYQSLAEEMKAPDVPLHALHRRVGGSIHELHDFLREECLGHRPIPQLTIEDHRNGTFVRSHKEKTER